MYVTMDLINEFLESNGFMTIVVFVDKLPEMVHLAKCKKEVADMKHAKIFVDDVFQLYGLAKVTISERDTHYTSKFWQALFGLLNRHL